MTKTKSKCYCEIPFHETDCKCKCHSPKVLNVQKLSSKGQEGEESSKSMGLSKSYEQPKNSQDAEKMVTSSPSFQDKYIKIYESKKLPKTSIYSVFSICSDCVIGVIKWYPSWRHYCFFPLSETIYSDRCLFNIFDFVNNLNKGKAEKSRQSVRDIVQQWVKAVDSIKLKGKAEKGKIKVGIQSGATDSGRLASTSLQNLASNPSQEPSLSTTTKAEIGHRQVSNLTNQKEMKHDADISPSSFEKDIINVFFEKEFPLLSKRVLCVSSVMECCLDKLVVERDYIEKQKVIDALDKLISKYEKEMSFYDESPIDILNIVKKELNLK